MVEIEQITDCISLGWLNIGLFAASAPHLTKREIERKGSVLLLNKMLKTEGLSLTYDEFNKPFLTGRTEHISISHSHDWLVIAINKTQKIGVDVELIREKVLMIKNKFVTETESEFAGSDIQLLTLIWSAKEAIYKSYGKKNIEFKNILIDPFALNNSGTMFGCLKTVTLNLTYNLIYKTKKDYVLVLTTDEREI